MTCSLSILPPGSRIVEIKAKPTVDPQTGKWSDGPVFALVRTNGRLSENPASTGMEEDK